jgi:putative ABC transport system permease protein
MGVLRALGFSRRQVARAVSSQGAAIGIVAVVVGVPLGYAIGRWVWVTHATNIGIGKYLDVPAATIVAVALGAVVLATLIAAAAGIRASRRRLTSALRVE